MRGVSLPDKYAPVIVVNGADSYAARLFTLVHELTHLCLGERSVSGSGTDFIAYESVSRVERFCDQVAAETLVPKSELADFLAKIPSPPSAETLESAATHFKVSRAVIALRLVAVGAVTQRFLRDHQYVFHRPGNEQPKREVKIPASTRVLSRFGRRFTKLVISAYGDDSIHGGELSSLLRMKMKSLPSLESKLFASRVSAVRPS